MRSGYHTLVWAHICPSQFSCVVSRRGRESGSVSKAVSRIAHLHYHGCYPWRSESISQLPKRPAKKNPPFFTDRRRWLKNNTSVYTPGPRVHQRHTENRAAQHSRRSHTSDLLIILTQCVSDRGSRSAFPFHENKIGNVVVDFRDLTERRRPPFHVYIYHPCVHPGCSFAIAPRYASSDV